MSLSHERAHDDQLVRYLLGLLNEEEAEKVDALCVTDDEIADRLRALENDLVDGYVSGTLTGPSLQQFQRTYLTSPRRREKVRFAESLLRATRLDPAAAPERTSSVMLGRIRGWVEPLFDRPNAGWGLAMAGTLLVLLAMLQIQSIRLRQELQDVQSDRLAMAQRAQELAREIVEQRSASAETASELERVRDALTDAVRMTPVHGARDDQPGMLAAMLLLPQMRSVGPVPTLVVPPRARTAAFDLQLEPSDFRQFQVVLRNPATSDIVWRSDRLTPSASGRTRTVSIAVPVRLLKAQHYAFELSGAGDASGGGGDPIAGYAFRIVLR